MVLSSQGLNQSRPALYKRGLLWGLLSLLVLLSALSLWTGAARNSGAVFRFSRIPRLVALVLTGAGISVSGLIMQRISRNSFVSPGTAGTQNGAALGFVLSQLYLSGQSVLIRSLSSFFMALLTTLFFFFLLSRLKGRSGVLPPLLGMVLGGIYMGLSQIIAYKASLLQALSSWILADYSLLIAGRYEMLFLILPAVLTAYAFAHRLTLAGMGKEMAVSLGGGYRRTLALGILLVSLISALTVVTAGRIPFLGLVVPNLITWKVSDNVRSILPLTALTGSCLLLIADLTGRWLLMPYEIPVGVTMGIVGGALFLHILYKREVSR